jgi:hypothetical protein
VVEIKGEFRDDGAPNTASTTVFNGTSAPCSSSGSATTTFANSSYVEDDYWFFTVTATSSSPGFVNATIEYTVNDGG